MNSMTSLLYLLPKDLFVKAPPLISNSYQNSGLRAKVKIEVDAAAFYSSLNSATLRSFSLNSNWSICAQNAYFPINSKRGFQYCGFHSFLTELD